MAIDIDGPVILGGYAFVDHQVPDKISFGGKQVHKVHDLLGGQRIVDAMGPTPDDKTWSGRFRGAFAIQNAQAIDAMRIAGAEVELEWLGLYYTVLITEFKADTEKPYEVPYSITCVVVDDPMQDAAAGSGGSLDSLVGGDMSSADSIMAEAPAGVASALSGMSGAIAAAGTLQGAAASVLAPVAMATNLAVSTITGAMNANDPALNAVSPDGADPLTMATWLSGTAGAMVAQSGLADGIGYVSRIGLNLSLGAN